MQLYARENDNTAEVPISGVIEVAGWDHISVVTYRNKERIGYNKSVLAYGGKTSATFDLKPKITAEMADYDFEVYACKQADSALIVKRTEIVAGDFYVISGQSNASANHFGAWTSKYARTIARIPDNDPTVRQGDTLWIPSSWSWPYAGAWGVELQKYILENHGIPTCVINGGLPGSYITYHNDRNAQNPASPTLYGFLYGRIKVAKAKRIRAFFWYQGEEEALSNIQNYSEEYDKLFKYWQTDYPQVEKFVVVQIPVLFNPNYVAGTIRDFQRRTKYIYPKTDHFNVSGLPGFDGIHYDLPGYRELGRRFYEFINPMYYGSEDSSNVACPDIQKVFYSSDKKDEITLLYEPGQNLVWPKDTLLADVTGAKFMKGLKEAQGNKVTLKLSAGAAAKKLTYLPAYKGEKVSVYYGPFLKNTRGLAAFSFQDVAIADLLTFKKLEAKESDMATVVVSWESTGAESYELERKGPADANFKPVKTFDGKTLSYEDRDVSPDATYAYRIQAFSGASQSVAQIVSIKMSPLLSVKPHAQDQFWKVYPNPMTDEVTVDFSKLQTGTLRLQNASGQNLRTGILEVQGNYKMNVGSLPSGLYILSIIQADGTVVSRKVMKD
jgi:Cu/Ag efflux protein CusF